MDIGFIGLGAMGVAMARNIAQAGHRVRAWNRSRRDAEAVEGLGVVADPADAFQADAVFTMLADDAAIREVILAPGVLSGARPGLVHAVASTISVDLADELRAAHAQAGLGYVSTPVFGRPDAAAAAQLNVLAAGDRQAIAKIRPLLDVIGKKTWLLGDDPKQANAAKIAGNMMIAMAIEAMGEAVVLTESNGLQAETFLDLMQQTLFSAPAYKNYGANIVNETFEPGFRMRLGLKDLRLATAAAERSGARLPMLDAVRTQMSDAVDAGMGEQDWSGVAGYTRRR